MSGGDLFLAGLRQKFLDPLQVEAVLVEWRCRRVRRQVSSGYAVATGPVQDECRWCAVTRSAQCYGVRRLHGGWPCSSRWWALPACSHSRSARTRELGIRLAVGSEPRNLLMRMIAEGAAMTLGGLALGFACGFGWSN
jgi:hypothetical protein